MRLSAFSSRSKTSAVKAENPFALPEKVEEQEEKMGLDEILGSQASFHFKADFPTSATTGLYPVAGGVGVSTLVNASLGELTEPTGEESHVILVTTTAADHLLKAAALLRQGYTPTGAEIIGVVAVHDRPKLSKATVAEARKVLRMAHHGWVIPYISELREPGEPVTKYPKRFRAVLTELQEATATQQ